MKSSSCLRLNSLLPSSTLIKYNSYIKYLGVRICPDLDLDFGASLTWLTKVSPQFNHLSGCLPAHKNISTNVTHHILFISFFGVVLSLCDLYSHY